MSTGERIKFLRLLRNKTQKMLGLSVGLPADTADVRIAQYEIGARTPKDTILQGIADSLDVSSMALSVPNIESEEPIMHTLFALEDIYGFKISLLEGRLCLCLDEDAGTMYHDLPERFAAWYLMQQKYENGEIDEQQYNNWRYKYPLQPLSKGIAEKEIRELAKNANGKNPKSTIPPRDTEYYLL